MAVVDTAVAPLDVSVVVVGYRTPDLVERCVASVERETTALAYEVVVVDNDGDPVEARALAARHPSCRVITPPENVGFARAVNLGVGAARGRYVLLLNPDTTVVAGAVERLVAFADHHPGHGLYGGRTLDPDGNLDPRSCWGFPTLWSTLCFALGLSTAFKGSPTFDPESLGPWRRDTVRPVDVVTGCLCLAPRATWLELGGFDERFFVYGEDVDLGLRARAAGYRPLLCPEATVVHDVGRSSATRADKLVLLHRGKVSLLQKHWSGPAARAGVGLLRLGVALRAVLGHDAWPELHRRRSEWVAGHPPVPA
jgi:N-acetylglucosaminyl-diphospho-decaprenol L-rhamnosyltransferase